MQNKNTASVKIKSVALCTYNGENYIKSQLLSILTQTNEVDEIIICDDGSTDATSTIIEQVMLNYPGKIKLTANAANLGVIKNFEQAINLCIGDLIFLSDQDDVWLPDKVANTISFFEENPLCYAAFSDAFLIDDMGQKHVPTLWQILNFKRDAEKAEKLDIMRQLLFYRNVITGACLAFKREAVNIVMPFNSMFLHDEWIGLKLASIGRLYYINQEMIKYRIHDGQVTQIRNYLNNAKNEATSTFEKTPDLDTQPVEYYQHWKRRLIFASKVLGQGISIDENLLNQMNMERKKGMLKILNTFRFLKKKQSLFIMWLTRREKITFSDVLFQ